jgi:hypothetical protein
VPVRFILIDVFSDVSFANRNDGVLPPGVSDMLSSPENFQIPLFAALAVSPICLLMSTTLFDRSVGKEHIFEV